MRRLPRFAPLLACAAVVAGVFGSPARAEEDARTKSFKDLNFKWTIPEAWAWGELSETEKSSGFVVVARRTVSEGVTASARVRVVDAAGSSLESMLSQIKDTKSKDLEGPLTDEKDVDWAGVPARRLEVTGKHESGTAVAVEVYGTIASGKFHQLEIRCVNSAETQIRDELNDVAAGYAFLEAPLTGEAAAAPPPQEFPQYGLTWSLPKPTQMPAAKEDEPARVVRWGWGTSPNLQPKAPAGEPALLAIAGIAGEGSSPVVISLQAQKAPVGMTAQGVAEFDQNFTSDLQQFSDVPAPRLDPEADLGNLIAASRTFSGKDKNDPPRPLHARFFFTVLKDWLFRVEVWSHEKAEVTHKKQIAEALAGLQWAGVKSGIRGPRVSPFPTYTDVRADALDAGKDTNFLHTALTLKKPASFARMKFDATERGASEYQFAAEARKEGAYAFVGIKRWLLTSFTNAKPVKAPESVIDTHEGDWKNEMDDPVTMTQKGGKANKSQEGIAGAKGHFYEFRGTKEKTPYVEKGWVVKDGLNVFQVRVQYGGKDAEAAFGADVKSMLKSLKFGK
jgi:hypothetical protein